MRRIMPVAHVLGVMLDVTALLLTRSFFLRVYYSAVARIVIVRPAEAYRLNMRGSITKAASGVLHLSNRLQLTVSMKLPLMPSAVFFMLAVKLFGAVWKGTVHAAMVARSTVEVNLILNT